MHPLDELRELARLASSASVYEALKPVFQRLDEIARLHSGDLDVQLASAELKKQVLRKAAELKQREPAAPVAAEPVTAPQRVSAAPEAAMTLRGPLVTGVIAGLIMAVLAIAVIYNIKLRRERAMTAPVAVKIVTVPPGATVTRQGATLCVTDCETHLAPGKHVLEVQMDGYEAVTREAEVLPGEPLRIELKLAPARPAVRIYADLAQGQAKLDGVPAGGLEGGQLLLEGIEPGSHTLEITSGSGSATLAFEVAPGKAPVLRGPLQARELLAVAVSSMGKQARVATSAGPLKLALNGQPQGEATPEGLDLTGFQPGPAELVVGEGRPARTIAETFTAAPALTVFLKSEANTGTLVVVTGQDDVRVFVNGKEHPRRTQRGQVRIPALGNITVRVEKDGFEEVEAKTATVAKGAEVRLNFPLRPLPDFSVLSITDGVPGAEVWIDGRQIGSVGPNGRFLNSSVEPGEHVIEMRREQYETKRYQRTFPHGRPVTISGADAALVAIRAARQPEPEPSAPPPLPPPPPPPAPKVVAAPKPVVGSMAQFDNPSLWREQDGIFRRRGAGVYTYSLTPNGVFTFTIYLLKGGNIFRSGRVRWVAQYLNARNYLLYELDSENLWAKVVENGTTYERKKIPHGVNKNVKNWRLQVDLSPAAAVQRIERSGQWVTLDSFSEPGRNFTQGKFGILINGDDEVGLADFEFVGR